MREVIVCDVDDILFEFYLTLTLFHNERYRTNLRKEDFTSYLVHEVWKCPSTEAIRRLWEFYGTVDFQFLPLVDGAAHGIRKLAGTYDLVAVTGRPHGLTSVTRDSLDRHFEGLFKEVYHTDAFGIGGGVPVPKVHVCAEVGAEILIEDYHGHALPCAEVGMDVLLFDQPWNRGAPAHKGIRRVSSWSEILGILL